nr:DnaD domain protein [uncultured Sellimonas sp.]
MSSLKIKNRTACSCTLVNNDFIDSYMLKANGEYVKVYLLLLRYMGSNDSFSISEFADILENTEGDILRALKYWEKEGLLFIEYDSDNKVTGIIVGYSESEKPKESTKSSKISETIVSKPATGSDDQDSSHSKRPVPDISQFRSRKEFRQLLFVAEQYIGRTLSPSDVEMLTYFYDTLHFSADLVEYLIEYCVENGHKSMHYIKSVALAWADAGIETVSEARKSATFYNKDCSAVLKAFGITGRMAASVETDFVKKWTGQFGFTLDVVIEACNRTVSAIHQPSFEYADRILSNWHNKGVHHLSDIAALDAAYLKKRAEKSTASAPVPKKTRFSNFEERDYNMDDLERQLLQN